MCARPVPRFPKNTEKPCFWKNQGYVILHVKCSATWWDIWVLEYQEAVRACAMHRSSVFNVGDLNFMLQRWLLVTPM